MNMKKILLILFVVTAGLIGRNVEAQIVDRQAVINDLNTIDENIKKWFPRWRVCEPDLQMQVYNSFLYRGVPENEIDFGLVEILAAPKPDDVDAEYQILAITCGQTTISGDQIDSWLPSMLISYLAGEFHYVDPPGDEIARGDAFFGEEEGDPYTREYCYTDIPVEAPLSPSSASAIIDFLHPTNKQHVFTLSAFEQTVKIGGSGFWLTSTLGMDEIGMPFWYAGQNSITIQRPLIENKFRTKDRIPYLLNIQLGGAYRTSNGIGGENDIFSWVPDRILNSSKSGYVVIGADFHLPVEGYTEAGISAHMSFPLQGVEGTDVNLGDYGRYINNNASMMYLPYHDGLEARPVTGHNEQGVVVVPMIQESGKFSAFYHWWLNKKNPENYVRFDLGFSFSNIQETGLYYTYDPDVDPGHEETTQVYHIATEDQTDYNGNKVLEGLENWSADGIGDWIYAKAEYRHQKAYPFGASAQISNGLFMGRVWLPLFGEWFYLEAKYSTPIHDVRPYELENFYMISPVIRLAI
jgi:hypothetical protein